MDSGAMEIEPLPQDGATFEALPLLNLQGGFQWTNQVPQSEDDEAISASGSNDESHTLGKASKKKIGRAHV